MSAEPLLQSLDRVRAQLERADQRLQQLEQNCNPTAESEAATRIQAAFRGKAQRKKFAELSALLDEKLQVRAKRSGGKKKTQLIMPDDHHPGEDSPSSIVAGLPQDLRASNPAGAAMSQKTSMDSTAVGGSSDVRASQNLRGSMQSNLRGSMQSNAGDLPSHGVSKKSIGLGKFQHSVKNLIITGRSFKHLTGQSGFMEKQYQQGRFRFFMFITFFVGWITAIGAVMAQSRVALFHMQAVGRWDHGRAYRFSYPWTVTFLAFLIQSLIGLHKYYEMKAEAKAKEEEEEQEDDLMASMAPQKTGMEHYKHVFKKYFLVGIQVVLDMVSQWASSWALVFGVPATIFVVLRSSGIVFMAVLSIIGGKLNWWKDRGVSKARWIAMLFLVVGLVMSSYCESGGGPPARRRRPQNARQSHAVLGILFLLGGEAMRSISLMLQGVCLNSGQWKSVLHMQGMQAAMGLVLTVVIMAISRHFYVHMPDGAQHPLSDPVDVFTMCTNNKFLIVALVVHLSSHVGSEISHMMILEHIDALQRQLCEAFKVIAIWIMGKIWWYFDILPTLQEAWKPGLTGSMGFPLSMILVTYGMLMYKEDKLFITTFLMQYWAALKAGKGIATARDAYEEHHESFLDAELEIARQLTPPSGDDVSRSSSTPNPRARDTGLAPVPFNHEDLWDPRFKRRLQKEALLRRHGSFTSERVEELLDEHADNKHLDILRKEGKTSGRRKSLS